MKHIKLSITLLFLLGLFSQNVFSQGPNIIGGDPIDISEAPWQVSVERNGDHWCGGSILNNEWILSAGHCYDGWSGPFTIHAGSTDQTDNSVGQIVTVDQVIIHPGYSGVLDGNDLALLHVSTPLCFNENVQAIEYATPQNSDLSDFADGTMALLTGWGAIVDYSCCSDVLMAINIPIINNPDASDMLDDSDNICSPGSNAVGPTMLAFYEQGSAAAPGDSGGPAVIIVDGEPLLVGASSWGGCPREDFPTMYADVRDLSTFIDDNITSTLTPSCCGSGSDIHINTNTTYDTNQEVSGDIIVHTGAQLTITGATLQFGKNKKIVVEQGAKLLVDNGTLTKCDDAQDWRGIIVEGNSNLPQPNAFSMPSANEAGVVLVINNSLIEWSRTGIATNYYGSWTNQKWGGLVHCENSNFIKNRRAVAFMKYKSFTNQSKFINCTFDGDNFAFGETFGVTIWATDGVTFNQCRFYNMDDSGILTIDAGPIVKGGNDFTDNYYGIYTTATHPYAAFLEVGDDGFDPNYFVSNTVDINANATDKGAGTKIVNNQFFDSFISNLLIGPSKYRIRNNAFANMIAGVLPVQTGALDYNQHNYVAKNDFNAPIAVYALGPNRELQVLCNNFQSDYDFPLAEYDDVPGEVRLYQGSYASPAGNCFTNPQINTDIYTIDPTVSFTYYHEADPTCQVPVTPGNYTPTLSPNASCTDPIWEGMITESNLIYVKSQIAGLEAAGDTRSEKYYALVQAKDYLLSSLLNQYLGRGDIKGALRVVSKDTSPFGQLATFGILMDNGMYADADNFLRGMSINDPEMKEFRSIQNINIARLTSTKPYVLNQTDQRYLENIAQSDLGVRAYARGILLILTGTTYQDDILSGAGGSKRFKLPSKGSTKGKTALTDKAISDQLHSFNVSPNPTTDQFAITFDPSQYDKELYVKVLNVNGQVIYDTTIPSDQNQVQVSTMDWNNGLYMLQITDQSGQLIYSSKMLKQ